MSLRPRRPLPLVTPGLLALLAAGALLLLPVSGGGAAAQQVDQQALAIERQLRCPTCTSTRLDACELRICEDMRQIIGDRLAAGDHPDDIILYFTQRFGDRIRYDLRRSGFNLVLFAWVGGSIGAAAVAGAAVLLRLRRSAGAAPAAISTADERWLDEQLGRGGGSGG